MRSFADKRLVYESHFFSLPKLFLTFIEDHLTISIINLFINAYLKKKKIEIPGEYKEFRILSDLFFVLGFISTCTSCVNDANEIS